jgi:phospholipase C
MSRVLHYALVIACLVLSILVTLWGYSALAYAQTGPQTGTSSTLTPIRHVIIVMMENHSFDNIFGIYPEVQGNTTNLTKQIERPTNLLGLKSFSNLTPVPNGTYSTEDPIEGYTTYHNDFNNGLMNGFLNNSGPQSMTYFTSNQLSSEWILAEEFGLGDRYFSSYMSETIPNRLMALAGFTPVRADYGPPPYIPYNKTIFYELQYFNIGWSYYTVTSSTSSIPLDFISGFGSSSRYVQNWSSFYRAVNSSSLPAVSWVMPVGTIDSQYSQHPPRNMSLGEEWMLNIVNAVMHSSIWNSSAIFITYDEGGGYYDQIAPPVLDNIQLGFRVPLIVISPYAKEDYVSNTLLNHDSLLAFIDYNWKIPPLNRFVSFSKIPIDFFDFNKKYSSGSILRRPFTLNANDTFPIEPQIPFELLPYARDGSSNLSLQALNIAPFIASNTQKRDSGNYYLLAVFLLSLVLIAVFTLVYLHKRIRRQR